MISEYLGIEIGIRGIWLSSIKADKDSVSSENTDFFSYEGSFSIENIEKALHDVLKKTDPTTLIVSVSPLFASFRLLSFPFSSESKIRQIIDLEMESLVPIQTESIKTEFIKLASRSDKKNSSVLACCLESIFIDTITSQIRAAGFELTSIGVSGLASASNYASEYASGDQSDFPQKCIYADISTEYAFFALIADGEVVFVRSISLRSDATQTAPSISTEALRTLTYYIDFHDPDFEADVFVYTLNTPCGSEAFDSSWSSALRDSILSTGLTCLKIEHNHASSLNPASIASLFYSKKRFINYAKSSFFRPGILKNATRNWSDSIALLAATCLIAFIYLAVSEYSSYRALKKLDKEINTIFTETFPEVKKIVDPYQQMSVKVKSLIQGSDTGPEKNLMIDIFKEISVRVKPEIDITLTSCAILPEEIQLQGEAASFDLAETARKALSESAMFKDVKVDSVSSDNKSGKAVFRLNLKRSGRG